jgi:hypothetical protein
MVTSQQKKISIIMGIIVFISLTAGVTLFTLSKKVAEKKTNELKLKLIKSGKPTWDVAASILL